MIWGLLALILVLVLLAMALTRQNMGRAAPLALLVVVGIIAYFAWYQEQSLQDAKLLIAPSEVELAEMRLQRDDRASWLIGRVRNLSAQYTLHELVLRASLEDCVAEQCETVDQADIIFKPDVPAQQARDFRQRIYFTAPLNPRGELTPRYEVLATRGR